DEEARPPRRVRPLDQWQKTRPLCSRRNLDASRPRERRSEVHIENQMRIRARNLAISGVVARDHRDPYRLLVWNGLGRPSMLTVRQAVVRGVEDQGVVQATGGRQRGQDV